MKLDFLEELQDCPFMKASIKQPLAEEKVDQE